MEQLKVTKKDIIILNVVIYLALSFFFLFLQHAYRHHLSPFSLVYTKKSVELFWYIAVILCTAAVLVWRHHRYAIPMYIVSVALVGFKVVEGLFLEFNKMIVIAMFFYAIISYFLYQLLKFYLELASINPNYSRTDLFSPLLREIPCKVIAGDDEYKGFLTNWDAEGCFIRLEHLKPLPNHLNVKVFFQDREFVQQGEVVAVALDYSGVGIKFDKSLRDMNVFNWSEFMEIVEELGFEPERLR